MSDYISFSEILAVLLEQKNKGLDPRKDVLITHKGFTIVVCYEEFLIQEVLPKLGFKETSSIKIRSLEV